MALPVLGCRSPPTTPQPNAAPTSILLGRPWPQGSMVFPTTVVFINLGRQLPRIDDNSKTAPTRHDINNPAIIIQLHLAAMNAHEIQIISATIEVNEAASAWSLQHDIILYRGRYYIPVTSPLL
jgi:hypothetical protein